MSAQRYGVHGDRVKFLDRIVAWETAVQRYVAQSGKTLDPALAIAVVNSVK